MTALQSKLAECGFPKRHILFLAQIPSTPQSDTWLAKGRVICDRYTQWLGSTCAIIGLRGTGKTQLATYCAYQLLQNIDRTIRYCTAMDFLVDIKSTFGHRDGPTESSVIAEYAKPSFLVIDEFDKRSETDWENNLLFYLLDRRYRSMKDTLLISNHGPRNFATSIGDSLVSRMNETGSIYTCDWESFR